MSDIKRIIAKLTQFRDERDWKQFHNPKDLSLALSIEASELLELFLWKDKTEIQSVDKDKIKEELADVFSFAFLMLEHFDFDLIDILEQKIELNTKKYPVEKSKGRSTKYKDL